MAKKSRRDKRHQGAKQGNRQKGAERAAGKEGAREQPGREDAQQSRRQDLLQRAERWIPLVLVALTVLLFARTAQFEFLEWDDMSLVAENPRFNPATLPSLLAFWTEDYRGFYSPLTYSAYWLQTVLLGMHGGRFHVVNLVLHASNVVLVYAVVRRLVNARFARISRQDGGRSRRSRSAPGEDPAAPWVAAAGALLFAVHPLQVESVAWVTAIKDLLSTFFALLAVYFYFGRKRATAGPMKYWPPGTVWYVLALLAKPTVVVLGPIVVVLDIAVRGTAWRAAVRDVALWLVLAVPIALVTKLVQPSGMLEEVAPLWLRPFVAADALQFYLAKLVAPLGLVPDYGRTPGWLLETGTWRWTWLIPAALAALAIFAAWRRRYALLAVLAAFILALSPVLGIVPFLYQRQSTVADHYMYFPFVIVAIGTGLLLAELTGRRRGGAVAAVVAAAAVFAALAFAQVPRWQDDEAFFKYAIEHNKDGALLRMTFGQSLARDGRYGESLIQFRKTAELRPHSDVYNNIGTALVNLKRYDDAREAFEQAREIDPDDRSAHRNLARLAEMLGE